MRWTDLAAGTLTVGRAQTKASARRTRAIAVPAVTGRELRAWQLESGARGAEPIIGDMKIASTVLNRPAKTIAEPPVLASPVPTSPPTSACDHRRARTGMDGRVHG